MLQHRQHLCKHRESLSSSTLLDTHTVHISTSSAASAAMRRGYGSLFSDEDDMDMVDNAMPPASSSATSNDGRNDSNATGWEPPSPEQCEEEDRATVKNEWERYCRDGVITDVQELNDLDLVRWWQVR